MQLLSDVLKLDLDWTGWHCHCHTCCLSRAKGVLLPGVHLQLEVVSYKPYTLRSLGANKVLRQVHL